MMIRFLLLSFFLIGQVLGAVPALINHQGRIAVLQDGVFSDFHGGGQFKFALVNANGSTTYWSNDGTSTAGSAPAASVPLIVNHGLYDVLLGDTALTNMMALPTEVFDQADIRLRIWFSSGPPIGFEQITPDHRLASAPYAQVANRVALANIVAPPVKPVVAWGNNAGGKTTVPALGSVVAVAAGSTQSLALLSSGTVVAWGTGAAVPLGLSNVTQISAGRTHFLARKGDGSVVAWGDNTAGKASVPGGITTATAVAAGRSHSLALLANGTVVAWGNNSYGQTTVPSSATNVIAIACGNDHCLALKGNGSIVAWGYDVLGQVTGTRPILGEIQFIIDPTHYQLSRTLAVGTANLVYDGSTVVSSTGDGSAVVEVADTSGLSPGMIVTSGNMVGPSSLTNVVAIAAGGHHSLAIKSDGTVAAWGWDNAGQCSVPASLGNVTRVAGGEGFSLALRANGSVVAWGEAADGLLALPSTATQVIQIAAGERHALALRADLIPAQVARLDQDNVFTQRVGIGRTATANALEVEGNAGKTTPGSWVSNSDRRIKEEIQPVTGALEKLNQVRLVDYRYTDQYRAVHPTVENKRYLSVIAQEFAEVFPDHVKSSGEKLPDGSDILQVDTYPLTIYSAAAVQELHRENQALKSKIAQQDGTLREQKKAINDQEKRLRKIEASLPR